MSRDTRLSPRGRCATAAGIWIPGLAVATGAAVATAHGLFEVAVAARVPAGLAWIYPLITDGLAMVAYTATARLRGSAARYAWGVVIGAAGLSGLAQAAYLASDAALTEGGAIAISPALRFGVGAWPAIAAAVVAHLLYLLAGSRPVVDRRPLNGRSPTPSHLSGTVQPPLTAGDGGTGDSNTDLNTSRTAVPARTTPASAAARVVPDASPRDRAWVAALRYAGRHGRWPTVSSLEAAAKVSRGTAATVLKTLREQPPQVLDATHAAEDEPRDDV
ncbi:hypothetical protein H7X46_11530 [Pseudonocardia sp. C8]|uniref:hypothetical protein n=1 Tax=Pseudonocardia sp. C8 TaxID=2762759 RepID=UPI001642B945|nr:hypothetical protein [Pseudonocardia sp. C8]MBC3191692.1 hypothetical protein [Pseudonocardia sp. C8]